MQAPLPGGNSHNIPLVSALTLSSQAAEKKVFSLRENTDSQG